MRMRVLSLVKYFIIQLCVVRGPQLPPELLDPVLFYVGQIVTAVRGIPDLHLEVFHWLRLKLLTVLTRL